MATTNSGQFNVSRIGVTINQDNSTAVVLYYTNAGNGTGVVTRIMTIPAGAVGPITDQNGAQVTAQVPGPLASAISSFLAQLDGSVATGAAGNKLNL